MPWQGYAQSEKNMILIPLKTGKNPSTLFENLIIEPANLFIQSKPINNNSPHIQLQLNVVKNTIKYSTFLWYYYESGDYQKTNYPKAYQNYSFYLKINKKDVKLVVEELDFEKTMFIGLSQTAIIGNLEILYKECISESSIDINGNQEEAFNTYNISLSDHNSQKTILFTSLKKQTDKPLLIEWKNYTIFILEDSEKALKLKVRKNDP
ncbi:MAG: hypothetical protein ABJM36_02480 [Algibacter sp.]|uniref:hypothetical protein n=1 Tax=Algibacter sp. TaxID=1872428 RepID=UPI003296F0C4